MRHYIADLAGRSNLCAESRRDRRSRHLFEFSTSVLSVSPTPLSRESVNPPPLPLCFYQITEETVPADLREFELFCVFMWRYPSEKREGRTRGHRRVGLCDQQPPSKNFSLGDTLFFHNQRRGWGVQLRAVSQSLVIMKDWTECQGLAGWVPQLCFPYSRDSFT